MTYSTDGIKRLMRERLPPGVQTLIELVGAEAERVGISVYLVGGFVRDLLLGRPNVDLDFVVEGDAAALVRHLCQRYGGAPHVASTSFFGTVKWFLDGSWAQSLGLVTDPGDRAFSIDFARARREVYAYPGALPTVDPSPVTLEEDLRRRDFTINALAIRLPDGALIDQLGSIADLETGLIRVLHDRSFNDDSTRLFRAVRFAHRFGFRIEPHTASLIASGLAALPNVSGVRLERECTRILGESEPEIALISLDELGILSAIDPDLCADDWLRCAFRAARWLNQQVDTTDYWLLWLCHIDHFDRVAQRLNLAQDRIMAVRQVQRVLKALPTEYSALPSAIVHVIEPLSQPETVWAASPTAPQREYVLKYIAHWRQTFPLLNGNHLIAMDLHPGPAFGTILRKLRDARLDGEISTIEEERALVQKWIEQGLFEA